MFTGPRCQIIAVHTTLTILETTCQLALRSVEKFLAGRSKRSSAESMVLLSFQIQ